MLTDVTILLQRLSSEFAVNFSLKMPQHLKYLAAVPYDL